MCRLEHGDFGADIGAGRQPHAADDPGAQVRHDVAVQVGQHQHVEVVRSRDEQLRHNVHDPVVELDVGILCGHPAGYLQVETVGELHDVGLVDGRDLLASVRPRIVQGKPHNPLGATDGDGLDADTRVGADGATAQLADELDQPRGLVRAFLELDSRVQVLGVFADDDNVEVGEFRGRSGVGPAGTQAGVEIQLLAEGDVDAAKALADRRGQRTFDGDLVGTDRIEHVLRQHVPGALTDLGAGVLHVPIEGKPANVGSGIQHATGCLGNLRPGAITGNERHGMRRRHEDRLPCLQ